MSFEDDIKGQNTQLYPVVEINGTWYSTNNVTVDGNYCKPILMNIPSIKESVDIESRRFKISNVSLQFNNFPFEGVRFSDQLSETSLINKEATIYFKSQSDLREVFKGIVRRLSHDDEKVKVDLEDLTEQKAHKDLPLANLGDEDSIPDKYKNKPIPMVYGQVDKSPILPVDNYLEFITDSKDILDEVSLDSNKFGLKESSLFSRVGDYYLNVIQENQFTYNEGRYSFNGNNLYLFPNSGDESENRLMVVDSNSNFQVTITNSPNLYELTTNDFLSTSKESLLNILNETSSGNILGIDSTQITSDNYGFDRDLSEYLLFNLAFNFSPQYENAGNTKLLGIIINGYDLKDILDYDAVFYTNTNASTGGDGTDYSDLDGQTITSDDYGYDDVNNIIEATPNDAASASEVGFNNLLNIFDLEGIETDNSGSLYYDVNLISGSIGITGRVITLLNQKEVFSIQGRVVTSGWDIDDVSAGTYSPATFEGTLEGVFDNISLSREVGLLKPFSKEYYANVKGRINTFDDHPFLTDGDDPLAEQYEELAIQSFIQNPIDIIYDLVRSEIGHENINLDEYEQARLQHADWKFGFTVNKKISSKKLIEDIAKSTKCFPKFKNDGSFGFNTVKDSYTVEGDNSDYAGATPIKESEVISYSFKKTKPEQIYKKVTVSYNKDYAQDSYIKTTTPIDLGADDYYGIEDSADAHLEFESDYIRNEETANLLASFLSEQYKNDHLIFNLKLPLQYIDLEIGDLVKFENLFQGVAAYGIDYTDTTEVNGQSRYPLFMVTSTTKNLDSVSIECMQLHHLEETITEGIDYVAYSGDDIEISGNVELNNDNQSITILVNDSYDYSGLLGDSQYFKISGIERPVLPEFGDGDIVSVTHTYNPNDNSPNQFTLSWVDENDGALSVNDSASFGLADDEQITITLSSYDLPASSVIGDVNLDGGQSILDIVQMVNYTLGDLDLNQQQLENADINGDGIVNILDIVQLVNLILED